VVAHYDSAKSALSFSPSLVGNFRLSFSMMIGSIFLIALLTLVVWLHFWARRRA